MFQVKTRAGCVLLFLRVRSLDPASADSQARECGLAKSLVCRQEKSPPRVFGKDCFVFVAYSLIRG